MAYQEQPQAIMWGARSDGVLLGFTYERDQNVVAWHRHELGGFSDSNGDEIPVVESVAVRAAPDATRDELYMVVQRYINGGTKRYIEYMSKIWETEDEQEDAFYVDCGWTVVNGSPSATVTGLWHLEGETVGVYVDGTKHNERHGHERHGDARPHRVRSSRSATSTTATGRRCRSRAARRTARRRARSSASIASASGWSTRSA
jgi:hypothetical protein